jgi:hypothetical protein
MSPVDEFKKAHGEEWSKIVRSKAFNAAMVLLSAEKTNAIVKLTDEQIEKNGREILADLRGHISHENNLFTLHERKTFEISDLPPEDYEAEIATRTKPKRKKKT